MSQKRNRSRNFSERDKLLLLDVVKEHMHVIENKKTDNVTNKQRSEAWEKVCVSFNAQQDSGLRTPEQLKNVYDCIKRKARKDQSLDKVEMYKTGGGGYKKHLDETSEKVIAMLPTQTSSLVCAFDSDADYQGDEASDNVIIEELIVENQVVGENKETEDGNIASTLGSSQGKGKKRKNANLIFETVEMFTETEVKKQKSKEEFLRKINEGKLEKQEIDLKIKQEELEAQRLKFAREESEAQLRREILTVELENARVIFKKNRIELDKVEKT